MSNNSWEKFRIALSRKLGKIADKIFPDNDPEPADFIEPEGSDYTSHSEEEAKKLYLRYLKKDPFPQILPSLLNSADVGDYMQKIALIHPYSPGSRKAASYAMCVGTQVAYFDPDKSARHGLYHELKDGEVFKLNQFTCLCHNKGSFSASTLHCWAIQSSH